MSYLRILMDEMSDEIIALFTFTCIINNLDMHGMKDCCMARQTCRSRRAHTHCTHSTSHTTLVFHVINAALYTSHVTPVKATLWSRIKSLVTTMNLVRWGCTAAPVPVIVRSHQGCFEFESR